MRGIGQALASSTSYAPTSVVFQDLSNPNGPYQVGDQWTLTITGNPNTAVQGSASQNGAPMSTSNMGTTDTNGNLTLTGTFGAGDVGSWAESYLVGQGTPAPLNFTVNAPTASPGTLTMTNPGPTPVTSTGAPIAAVSLPAGIDLSFLTSNIGPLPLWAWLGGGLVAIILVKK
jgi:hypothetical protein